MINWNYYIRQINGDLCQLSPSLPSKLISLTGQTDSLWSVTIPTVTIRDTILSCLIFCRMLHTSLTFPNATKGGAAVVISPSISHLIWERLNKDGRLANISLLPANTFTK